MHSLRPKPISRLLVRAVPVARRLSPLWIRHNSQTETEPAPKSDASESPAPAAGDSSMIRQEDASQAMADHQPDFNAPVDHGTS